jgi:hypothetical protein
MARVRDRISWQTSTGDSVAVRDVRLTPESKALVVRWPNGGWVWNRPVAVLVEREGGGERMPIVDVTRIAQLALLGLGALFALVTVMLSARTRFSAIRESRVARVDA